MNETSAPDLWLDRLTGAYGDMLSVSDVARVLNLDERIIRHLLTNANADIRLPGVKIGKSWRIAREELHSYLVAHHNRDSAVEEGTL